ncbi:MAG TPA: membrane protein insertase YidC [Actinomycetota bacterium]|nr:membrane protein insertase YidC [Actinomycetota bacterium]
MFQSLVHGMGQLLAYFYSLIPNYGVAIIMLTVLVRALMIPLAIKQAHSMRANRGNQEKIRKLAPEVKKIKEKYKDDRQRQYEEQKKLYAEHDVNMLGGLGGCLPLLLQMPIFMAMYMLLQGCDKLIASNNCVPGMHIPHDSPLYAAIVERSASFLGANLEFRPAEVYAQSGVLGAWPYLVLVVVMGVTTWSQSQLMIKMQPAPDPQFAQTQKIMRWMPLMLVFFSWNFPAGLILYWAATNTWTIGQQYVLLKKFGGPAPEVTKKTEKGWLARTAAAALESGTSGEERTKSKPAAKGGATPKPKAANAPAKGKAAQGTRSGSAKGGGAKNQPGTRRPAAKQARVAPKASSSTGNGKEKAGGAGANGDSPTPARPAGRPKGSGSRKGNKGGRR